MKTFVDYLKEIKVCVIEVTDYTVAVELTETGYYIVDGNDKIYYPVYVCIDEELQDYLESKYGLEIRFCEVCGKPYDKGYMVDGGFWYCCEDCFEAAMDNDYGKGKWRASEEEGADGGWYEYLNDEDEWEDTGIFYTEWN